MGRVFNIPKQLTDKRRFSKDSKMVLAAWLGIKFAFGNSTLYDNSVENIIKFFHLRRDRAKKLLKLMAEDTELFYINEKKNCIFAKSCRDKSIKINRNGGKYKGDDVITIQVPEVYLRNKIEKEPLALEELVRLIEEALVIKEYDDHDGYKYKSDDNKAEDNSCETRKRKTQTCVAKRTGLSRTKVSRILKKYVGLGYLSRTERHIERCRVGEPYSFKAVNKKTRMEYYAKCEPVTFSWKERPPFSFRHIIWKSPKRISSSFMKSDKNLIKSIKDGFNNLVVADINEQLIVAREMARRVAYD